MNPPVIFFTERQFGHLVRFLPDTTLFMEGARA
jgi:hypothetical protein